METSSCFKAQWEKSILIELYKEYDSIVSMKSLKIKPVLIELVDSETFWGAWIPLKRSIQLSRKLVLKHPWFSVIGILKHEMAHQLVEEKYLAHQGFDLNQVTPHGDLFKKACSEIGVPHQFSKSNSNLQESSLDWRDEIRDEATEKLLERVRKLLSLATSSNENEALAAMNKVRELYLKYNISGVDRLNDPRGYFHLVMSLDKARLESEDQRILSILISHFFVKVIVGSYYNVKKQLHQKQIEIIGTKANVLMAEYVYEFLKSQIEILSDLALKQNVPRRTRMTKKSYRLGILSGFSEKLSLMESSSNSNAPSDINSSDIKSIVSLKKDVQLNRYISTIYPRLRSTRSARQSVDSSAYSEGKSMGRKLTLNKPIESRSTKKGFLLS